MARKRIKELYKLESQKNVFPKTKDNSRQPYSDKI